MPFFCWKIAGWYIFVGDAKIMLTLSLFWDKMQVFYHQWFTNRDFSDREKGGANSRIWLGKTGMAETPSIGGCKNSFTLKSSVQQHFFNISLLTAKTNGNAKFCHLFPKCNFCTLKLHFECQQTPRNGSLWRVFLESRHALPCGWPSPPDAL